MLDISEPGDKIGEKLLMLLNAKQRQELIKYLLHEEKQFGNPAARLRIFSEAHGTRMKADGGLTEIKEGDLYFCLEQWLVRVNGRNIELTVKEFDILTLLIMHPNCVFTYELILDLVWKEEYSACSRKVVSNHVSNLRKKLQNASGGLNYIRNVIGVGYKFEVP